ncbi:MULTISPECIES: amino acid ABC transporter substrate-binding protein [Variovorax]|jgi:ABC-type amino acid transport substrate-binding protein|uniref:amino acid ABC transporter substrate-binding protein n=1 Tax=Variovorax atrisoli TaxID=3394203 RepID=UPI00036C81E3|nr:MULTISPECIES: transporter substrate-binding domain-containing protein [Variovorax]MBB3638564.1 glutamate/aspartate transport system substrate-binding protein [Variovorax sp. BK613]RTD96299.1 amino acid ABC transporter substrate-binding protein [Variovorax sp. 369]
MDFKKLPLALGLALVFASGAAVAQYSGTLQKIKDSGTIQIGARDSQIPFSYKLGADGDPIGFTNDICLKIVDAVKARLGLAKIDVRYTMLNSTNRIPLLQNGTVDLDCATTTNTTQRQQQVDFAPSHFVANITAAVRKNSGIDTFADLNGKNVATVSGSTSIQLLRVARKSGTIEVNEIPGKDTSDGFLRLSNGRADAYVLDDVQLAGMIASSTNPGEYKILKESLRQEPYGIMLRKDDPQFKALVDETVTGLMKSGAIEQLYTKWFLSPIPPRNANLNFPMTDAVREIYKNPNNKGV